MFGKGSGKKNEPTAQSNEAAAFHHGSGAAALGGDTKIGVWLDDPRGGPVLRALLAEQGTHESKLEPVRNFALKRLVAMSWGNFTEETIAQLVVRAQEDGTWANRASGIEPIAPQSLDDGVVEGRFRGKTVIVTGAASGIGHAAASRIASEAGRIVAVDVQELGLEKLVAAHLAVEIVSVVADVTTQAGVDAIMAAAGTRVDGLVNAAMVGGGDVPLHELAHEEWQRGFDVNVTGVFRLLRAVLEPMRRAQSGAIVNVTAAADDAGLAQAVSVGAVEAMTRASAVTYAHEGIRVNAIHASAAAPESAAATISFLLSDGSRSPTGAIVHADGTGPVPP